MSSSQTTPLVSASSGTVVDSNTYGNLGVQLAVNGDALASTLAINASTDVLSYMYGGITDDPILSHSASGATTVKEQPPLAAPSITDSGQRDASNAPELDLYEPSGLSSQAMFSISEPDWTNSLFDQNVRSSLSGCSSIGTLSLASGTSFTFSGVSSPVVSSCTITMSGAPVKMVMIAATYTMSGFGVDGHARR